MRASRPSSLQACLVLALAALGSPQVAPAQSVPPRWSIELDLSMGDEQGADLVGTNAMVVAGDSRMYVAQGDHVVVFAADGTRVTTIGRAGTGPGEFARIGALGFHADTLWVIDRDRKRVSFFTLGGEPLRDVSALGFSRAPGLSANGPAALLADGRVLELYRPTRDTAEARVPMVVHDLDARRTDAFAYYRVRARELHVRGENWTWHTGQRFGATDAVSIAPDGSEVAVLDRSPPTAELDTIRATVYDARGQVVRRVAAPARAQRLTEAHRQRYAGDLYGTIAVLHEMPLTSARRLVDRYMYAPEFVPPATRILLSRSGELWLQRHTLQPDAQEWWVIGRDGDLAGSVLVPLRFNVLEADDRYLWGTWTTEAGEVRLRRYRIGR